MMSNNKCPIYYNEGKVIDEGMSEIEKILHSKKAKYTMLKPKADYYFENNKDVSDTINFYINLYDITKQLYQPSLIGDYKTIKSVLKMSMISEIINIAAHYRHFFYKYYGKFTTIIFYYSSKKDPYYTKIDSNYKSKFYNKRILHENQEYYIINKALKDCLFIIKEYFNYIPHVYLIDTGEVDPRLLPYIVSNSELKDFNNRINPKDFSVIMSTNKLDMLNLLYLDNSLIFKHKYKFKGYETKFISKNDIYEELEIENPIPLPNEYLKYLFAIAGNTDYGITNLKRMKEKKAYIFLSKNFVNGNSILNEIEKLDMADKFKSNLKLIDFESYPLNNLKKYNILKQFIDIPNFKYIKEETFKSFTNNIILLEYLFDGEEVI